MERIVTPRELICLIDKLSAMMESNQFKELNGILGSVDVESLAPEFIVTYLRTTFCCREYLTNWKRLVSQSHRTLKERGYDADVILQGLLT